MKTVFQRADLDRREQKCFFLNPEEVRSKRKIGHCKNPPVLWTAFSPQKKNSDLFRISFQVFPSHRLLQGKLQAHSATILCPRLRHYVAPHAIPSALRWRPSLTTSTTRQSISSTRTSTRQNTTNAGRTSSSTCFSPSWPSPRWWRKRWWRLSTSTPCPEMTSKVTPSSRGSSPACGYLSSSSLCIVASATSWVWGKWSNHQTSWCTSSPQELLPDWVTSSWL